MSWLHLAGDVNETPADRAERFQSERINLFRDAQQYLIDNNPYGIAPF